MRKILSKMPSGVKMSGGTPASVLVAICGSDMRVLLTKKAANLRIHANSDFSWRAAYTFTPNNM